MSTDSSKCIVVCMQSNLQLIDVNIVLYHCKKHLYSIEIIHVCVYGDIHV